MTSKLFSTLFLVIALASAVSVAKAETVSVDVCVYGATPGGIAASVSAAKSGKSVALVDPSAQVGGLVTSGLSHTDFHSFESLSGAYLEFANRVQQHYATNYSKDSPQYRDCFRGTFAEPKVNLLIFEEILAEQSDIKLILNTTLKSVNVVDAGDAKHVESATFKLSDYDPATVHAKVFIDATYEGDLMAMARVPYRVGREGRGEFGESLAPEKADSQLQAYNFRFCMTREDDNRVTPAAPPGYRREDFVGVLDVYLSWFCLQGTSCRE